LRVLQEREYERVGSSETIRTNARLLATSNRDLDEAIEKGAFRRDLFYRLNVVPITLPLLKDRHGDIPLLVEHFIRKHGGLRAAAGARRAETASVRISPEALAMLEAYAWPGNVRELENIIERAMVLEDGPVIQPEHIAPGLTGGPSLAAMAAPGAPAAPLVRGLHEVEREHVERVLAYFHGHRQKTATALGISERSLRDRLKRWKKEGT
ncbi:MAG: sigma 54-interacting transcriptional regulator, partial [Planctomycetota bacterium]